MRKVRFLLELFTYPKMITTATAHTFSNASQRPNLLFDAV